MLNVVVRIVTGRL